MIFSKLQIALFISLMSLLIVLSYFYIDKTISLYFIEHADKYKSVGKELSKLGESHWYIGIALIGIFYYKFIKTNELYKQRFLFLLYANLFSGIISIITKMLIGRLRPWKLENGNDGFGFLIAQNPNFSFFENLSYQVSMLLKDSTHYTSFPSGHTTTSLTVFTFMMILFPKQYYVWIPITLLGVSARILANDHFLSDVLGGTLVGVLCTLFIYSKMKEKIEKIY
ncbi:phosphatase PAP2 family protein [Sulfurimonas sp. SAG-AH-194-L11]|nr:phosphatase PAP2 family protein [Sulfurimonas sp. SAG-AH-194-L11]MDF1877631.1 phosphatase PAP2 family protein [Sulfurimonas sp. SAG-AH-194-L11]